MKHNNISFVAALVCALVADTAVYAKFWIVAIIMYAGFAFFLVKLMFDNKKYDEKLADEYKRTRRAVDRLYRHIEENRLMTSDEIKAVIESEEKPAGSVRPGSKQSNRFLKMKADKEEQHDAGREDQANAEV